MISQSIYIIAVLICITGLYMVIASNNYMSKIIGLGIFQNSILLFYIALGKATEGIPPIYIKKIDTIYSSPTPQVLMLTAIVVGFATLTTALAIAMRIYKHHGSLDIIQIKNNDNA